MLKKIICLILAMAFVIPLASCKNEEFYPEIESTEEESRIVFSFEIDGEVYDVKYELYRTLFLTYKKDVDGGDSSVWTSDNAERYVKQIDAKIIDAAANIYTVLHLAKKAGYDPYSKDVDTAIRKYVKYSVDGHQSSNMTVEGYNGDYQAYLNSLKEVYMNYSVQTLIYRYAIAYDNLLLYYYGNVDAENPTSDMVEGAIKYDDEILREYYKSDECVRVLAAKINTKYFTEKRAQEIRNNIATYSTETSVLRYILGQNLASDELDARMLIGRSTMDSTLFSNVLADAAFNIEFHETSPLVPYESDSGSYYFVFYRIDKSDDYFEDNKDAVIASYIGNEIGRRLAECKESLLSNVTKEALMSELDRSSISMS